MLPLRHTMRDSLFHPFDILPETQSDHTENEHIINNPFEYVPDEWSLRASREVQDYIHRSKKLSAEVSSGKMFGVLSVRNQDGEYGFLAAYSGYLNADEHPYFVPPILNIRDPQGYFRKEEERISGITRQIEQLEHSPEFLNGIKRLSEMRAEAVQQLEQFRQRIKNARSERRLLRQMETPDSELETKLMRESQFEKAELKRMEKRLRANVLDLEQKIQPFTCRLEALRSERKKRSNELQIWLHTHMILLNANGESKNLLEIFAAHASASKTEFRIPPGGSGDCAGPKLLQYAYARGYTPLSIAEFWWGNSPEHEIRHHGGFYPACKGRCEPILSHMLLGLPGYRQQEQLHSLTHPKLATETAQIPKILHEDDWFIVVEKVSGMLSVPGRTGHASAVSMLNEHGFPPSVLWAVHRLDMDTSGILILAKQEKALKAMQGLFRKREVSKQYEALLEGRVKTESGEIDLPLSADLLDRPRQKVDFESGKTAHTRFEVLERIPANEHHPELTRVSFYPQEGRTHQLRLHAAHPKGLACPIWGDRLYGKGPSPHTRMCLHATSVRFLHPFTEQVMEISSPCPF